MFGGKNSKGFTIVELLIVIVVIGILAAITVVAYNGIQQRAQFTQLKSDLASLNKAIQLYHAENGAYPIRSAWSGDNQVINDSFIHGLVPRYIDQTPQVANHSESRPTFLYLSNGVDYKLIYIADAGGEGSTGLLQLHRENNPLIDPARPTRAWGYWTEGYRTI